MSAFESSAGAIPVTRLRRNIWLATALIAGGVVMSLEMVALRLYAPYFGNSIYVWGATITLVMGAMAFGYLLGGRLADGVNSEMHMYIMIVGSGIYQAAALANVHLILSHLAQIDGTLGLVIATFVLLVPPLIALSGVTPMLTDLFSRGGNVGSSAGNLYAASTIGGIVAVLGTTFLLIPSMGTLAALKLNCAGTLLIGFLGLLSKRRWQPLVLLAPIILLTAQADGSTLDRSEAIQYSAESVYNQVGVSRQGRKVILYLNERSVAQSYYNLDTGWSGGYLDQFALGPLVAPAERILVLGLGGGSVVHVDRKSAPDAMIDAVEIDPLVIKVANEYFDTQVEEGRLDIHLADARPWLMRCQNQYQVVQVDLFQGSPFVPFYLVTDEFFRLIRSRMTGDGVLMLNVYDGGRDHQILNSIAATLSRSFSQLFVLSDPVGSHMVFAFPKSIDLMSLQTRLRQDIRDPQLSQLAMAASDEIKLLTPIRNTACFTDDHAPIERMTHQMLRESPVHLLKLRPKLRPKWYVVIIAVIAATAATGSFMMIMHKTRLQKSLSMELRSLGRSVF